MSAPALTFPKALKKSEVAKGVAERWRLDARIFVREVCKDTPDKWQDQFLAALSGLHEPGQDPPSMRLALKACKGPGKTRALAWAIWWWLFTRWHPNIIAMSITEDNLRDNLWSELARVQEQSYLLKTLFTHSGERIVANDFPKTWWCSARSFPQNADKNQQATTIAGMHGRHPMIVCDEVGDYPDGVVVAAEGIFTNEVDGRLCIAGNPTNTDGPLFRVCTRDRSYWWVKEITADPDNPDRASRCSIEEARRLINTWGRENNFVKVNVFGEFPSQGSNKLLSADEVMKCARELPLLNYNQDPVIYGLDVARYGDNESVLFRRQGRMSFRYRSWREMDLMTLADQVINEVAPYKPAAIFVDGSGIGGGVVDRMKQLGVSVISVDAGASPMDPKFDNRRSEMWWNMAQWLKGGGCIPNDPSLRAELIAPSFEYRQSSKVTKFRIESKADLKKRGMPSPDHADALALTFAAPVYIAPTMMQQITPEHRSAIGRINGGTDGSWDPLGGN